MLTFLYLIKYLLIILSTVSYSSSLSADSSASSESLKSFMSPPASSIDRVTASFIALLVYVAPDTVSTSTLCFSIIFAGICSSAPSATPTV